MKPDTETPSGGVAEATPPEAAEETLTDKLAREAAEQSPAEPQVVPEQRPQAATAPDPSQRSDTDLRVEAEGGNKPHGEDAYKNAEATPANLKKAESQEHQAILLEGQTVQITNGPNAGRMAFIIGHVFEDPGERIKFNTPGPERASAKADAYVVETRDGRSDRLEVKPGDLKTLDSINGWGRGTI